MKVFALLFSMYLLMLSGMPCNDGDECNGFFPAQTSVSAATQDNHKHEGENCTPFCPCSCCTTAVAHTSKSHFQPIRPVFPSRQYPVDKVLYASRSLASIWQPPRASW